MPPEGLTSMHRVVMNAQTMPKPRTETSCMVYYPQVLGSLAYKVLSWEPTIATSVASLNVACELQCAVPSFFTHMFGHGYPITGCRLCFARHKIPYFDELFKRTTGARKNRTCVLRYEPGAKRHIIELSLGGCDFGSIHTFLPLWLPHSCPYNVGRVCNA